MAVPGACRSPLRRAYDVVIVGAGVQGLALAYELAKLGVRDVAVLDRSYPGGGGSGRNGEMIRSAFGSREWTGLFDESLRRWRTLSAELDFNVLFSGTGYLVLASTPEQVERCRADAVRQAALGVRSQFVTAEEARRIVPEVNPELALGGVYQDHAGFAHHDAVVWGYARAAARLGVEIHTGVTVTGVEVSGGAVRGVRTDRGHVSTPVVVNAAGGGARAIAEMAGVRLPTRTCRLEMIVTESVAPFLRPALASLELLGYCHQTARGEFVGGTELPYPDVSDSLNGTYTLLADMAAKFVRLLPRLAGVRLLRHWAGLVDQADDLSPVIGPVPEVSGFHLTCGWVYGFMGAPATGALLARGIHEGVMPELLRPFSVTRLHEGRLIQEGTLVVAAEEGNAA
jgi:sarcosine oxidase subunit beta